MAGEIEWQRFVENLAGTALLSDLSREYSVRTPGDSVGELNKWLYKVRLQFLNQSHGVSESGGKETPTQPSIDEYRSLPLTLRKRMIILESQARIRSEAARLEAAKSQLSKQITHRLRVENAFETAFAMVEDRLRQHLETLCSDEEVDRDVVSPEGISSGFILLLDAESQDASSKSSSRSVLEFVSELPFSQWPEKYQNRLREVIKEAVLAGERKREARLELAQQQQHQQRLKELGADLSQGFAFFASKHSEALKKPSPERTVAIEHVKKWAANRLGVANLDDDQAAAVTSVTSHTQVVSRAGSGKTTVLAIRLCFLLLECGEEPDTLLTLTFNTKARDEVRTRVSRLLIYQDELSKNGSQSAKRLDLVLRNRKFDAEQQAVERGIRIPLIMTFHGFAHQIIVANLGDKAPRQIEGGSNDEKSTRIELSVRQLLGDSQGELRLRSLLRQYFSDDWEWLNSESKSPKELMELRRHLSHETLRGERVKSKGERKIANLLFRLGVDYQYENAFWTKDRYIFPDFTIFQDGRRVAVVEYAGLSGEPNYDLNLKRKLKSYDSFSVPNLVIYPWELAATARNGFVKKLKGFFQEISLREPAALSEEDVWERVKQRFETRGSNSRFMAALGLFLGKALREGLTPEEIRARVSFNLRGDPVGKEFALMAADVQVKYLDELSSRNEIDQTMALSLASQLVDSGADLFRVDGRECFVHELRSISVDEHQDFSIQFQSLLKAVASKADALVFAVGDDWQCINRFMGSEPHLFHSFSKDWEKAVRIEMPTNYRSGSGIVELSNSLMAERGVPARSSTLETSHLSLYFVDKLEQRSVETSAVKELSGRALRRVLIGELQEPGVEDVTVLTRTNHVPWIRGSEVSNFASSALSNYIDTLLPDLTPELRKRVKTSTVHSFKGLESDSVIVLDVQLRSFPLIHSDQRFQSFFSTPLEVLIEDERRLLYVAMTRPRKRLSILSRTDVAGPFISAPLLKHERDINKLTSAYMLIVQSKSKSFTASDRSFLGSRGFTIEQGLDHSHTSAWVDLTSKVISSGGLEAANLEISEVLPDLYFFCQSRGFEIAFYPDRQK